MAMTTGGYSSYSAVGNRESLADMIYRVDRDETPFVSAIGRGKASAVYEEWQTDALAAAVTSNAVLEGGDVTPVTSAPTTRLGNYCQISQKSWAVTGTQEVVNKAGKKSEIAYQKMKRGLELRRDIEAASTNVQGQVAGDATTARKSRALESWITSNDVRATGGADSTGAAYAPTDATAGDMVTFTETILKSVVKKVFDSGGMKRNGSILMMGSHARQLFSAFTGRASARQNIDASRIQATADLYASDFGTLKVVTNVHQRARSAFVFDPEYAEIRYLRPIQSKDLATIGDSERGFIQAEWTLCMKNEKAFGIAADLLTA